MISDKQILAHIERQPRGQAGFKQLIRELGLRGNERRELEDRLKTMKRRGELVEVGRDRYSLPQAASEENLVSGRLHMHRDGFGFVTPTNEELRNTIDGDIFIPPGAMGQAMHGDTVLVELSRQPRRGERIEGRVMKVVGRKHTTVVGVFHYGDRFNFVTPIDDRITQDIVIPFGQEVAGAGDEEEGDPDTEHRGRRKTRKRDMSRHRVIGNEAKLRESEDMEGVVVDVELTQFPSNSQQAKGKVIEVLGYESDFGVDVEIIIRKHHLPHVFPQEVLDHAQGIANVIPRSEVSARRDYRELPIVTIDGETARDFDDAVLVELLPSGNYELQVHIADVAQYVTEDTPLDDEARLRGTSVYFPDRAVPMLPLELSTDICSLRPNVERLVLSCIMEIDPAGEVLRYDIHEGIIRSAARMTYTDVQLILDGDQQARKQYSNLVENFERMRDLAERVNRKRVRRGSIDFDLPEAVIDFDDEGLMRGVSRSERKFSHRLIEEFMLSANECVADYLEKNQIAGLYRIHEKPDPKKLYDFETLAASFGYSLGVGALPVKRVQLKADRRDKRHDKGGRNTAAIELPEEVHITPRMYQKLTQKIAGKPEERILSYLMLRSLKQARYSEENEGHFALAATNYTHFTSPIRRYPDLIVHRILKEVIRQREGESRENIVSLRSDDSPNDSHGGSPWSKRTQGRHDARRQSKHQKQIIEQRRQEREGPIAEHILKDIAEESSQSERRADEAERELIEWKKLKFMQDRVGEDFDALITSVTKFGFFVELTDMFIEGLVPLQSLLDDHFTFRENTRQIIGERSRKAFSIGDRVHVYLERIDRVQRKLQFALVQEPVKPVKGRKKHRKQAW